MKTLNVLRDLLLQYTNSLKEIDSLDENIYNSHLTELKKQIDECIDILKQKEPVLFQLNYPDYLSDEDAKFFKENLRLSATTHYSINTLPIGEHFVDKINDDIFCTPKYTPWQDTHNQLQNFWIDYSTDTRESVKKQLNALLLNMLLSVPAKKLNLNIFDFSFSGLADLFTINLDSHLYHKDIVTNSEIAHTRIKLLLENMAIVMKKYGNIAEYNYHHKEIILPYEVVILLNYPNQYDSYIDELMPLVVNGPRCGIYFIVVNDANGELHNSNIDKNILRNGQNFKYLNADIEESPQNSLIRHTPFYNNARLMQICFEYLREDTNKKDTRAVLKQDFLKLKEKEYEPVISEINITVGLDIEDKHPVTLRFNSGDYIHAFILGQSGSGKSVLLNNIISSAITKYSPEDLLLYLMDFKGVEFNRYQGVKHVKALLTDNSDPQITLEVLRELKEENKKRVKLWQQEGVNNIDGYNRKHLEDRLPQILFIADECQIMFSSGLQRGSLRETQYEILDILNTIATQGRSQGIHMLLATQQLDETDISGQILKNLTECFLLMSAASDSERLVPDSSIHTGKQPTGQACYFHKRELQSKVQTFYATDEELGNAISASQQKALCSKSNGEFYFCGSSMFTYNFQDRELLERLSSKHPLAFLGKNIGIHQEPTIVTLTNDYTENILFFGTNKQEQTIGVAMNALQTLIHSYHTLGINCTFLVVDCYENPQAIYKNILEQWQNENQIHLIDRQRFGHSMKMIVEDLQNGNASPVIIMIIGEERFVEMKRNIPLTKELKGPEIVGGIEVLSFTDIPNLNGNSNISSNNSMTYQQAFRYILDEGPLQGIHVLLQVDKPGNILFEGDYGVNATDKFRHKVILRSENKFLQPMRLSKDIDVETLSEEEERLRAYYYPENDEPQLFTPYLMHNNN